MTRPDNRGAARIYAAGRVRRWHADPMMAHIPQTNWDHVGGCLALLLILNPTASAALMRAVLWHDLGERWVGDFSADFKRADPETADVIADVERRAVIKVLGEHPSDALTDNNLKWLHLVDRLEAYLFTAMYNPAELQRNGWPEGRVRLIVAACDLGVAMQVELMLTDAEAGLFA